MKLFLETKGSFQLISGGERVPHNRPAVVRKEYFWDMAIGDGRAKCLALLVDEATDEEFVTTLNACTDAEDPMALAVASFLERFEYQPEGVSEKPSGKGKGKRGGKKADEKTNNQGDDKDDDKTDDKGDGQDNGGA